MSPKKRFVKKLWHLAEGRGIISRQSPLTQSQSITNPCSTQTIPSCLLSETIAVHKRFRRNSSRHLNKIYFISFLVTHRFQGSAFCDRRRGSRHCCLISKNSSLKRTLFRWFDDASCLTSYRETWAFPNCVRVTRVRWSVPSGGSSSFFHFFHCQQTKQIIKFPCKCDIFVGVPLFLFNLCTHIPSSSHPFANPLNFFSLTHFYRIPFVH